VRIRQWLQRRYGALPVREALLRGWDNAPYRHLGRYIIFACSYACSKSQHTSTMAFVSPPPRPVSSILAQKRRESFWRKLPLKSLYRVIGRWSIGDEPQRTGGYDRSGIVDTASFSNSDAGMVLPETVRTFASLYCKEHGLQADRFVASVFWKTIFPRAHFWGVPIFVIWSREFSADREFIAQAGQVENMEQYLEVEEVFHRWPGCRSFLRGKLGLRVSSRRVHRLVTVAFTDAR